MGTKLEKEELGEIESLQDIYNNLLYKLGDVVTQKLDLQKELDRLESYENALKEEYSAFKQKEKDTLYVLFQKYGDGKINFKTGEIEKN